jgi:hypothetical protein
VSPRYQHRRVASVAHREDLFEHRRLERLGAVDGAVAARVQQHKLLFVVVAQCGGQSVEDLRGRLTATNRQSSDMGFSEVQAPLRAVMEVVDVGQRQVFGAHERANLLGRAGQEATVRMHCGQEVLDGTYLVNVLDLRQCVGVKDVGGRR